ncbi:ABC transporter ATP-binding protein [Natrarchaeobius oligotrophus]|uniref:ABC transporter ATP-binding protein n=1 Tax=Natrarchaeobius chitinivorans TaxID=1679083 RepID=A0A3N6MWV2_NATCH|nr:ABC transporter ATP-binding protein [Natrarchaeobius chitinivorans]RQG99466.1 ABC transporter ATP-binding protein [Natrarchaeobius chitinivorans]
MTLLEITDLQTQFETSEGRVHAVDGVNLSLEANESLGIIGESGSGKTTIAKSIVRLLPDNGEIVDGEVRYDGDDITEYSDRQLRKQIRWNEIAVIPQNAMNGFDPVYTVGDQIVEVITAHTDTPNDEAMERAKSLFQTLGIDEDRVHDYPHQFSGGMAQRAMIALALALDPSLLIADEPTTALDVMIQDRILHRIQELQDELDTAMIFITHDMSVVSETCDKIAVVYGGRIVEFADTETIIKNPRHPYTLGLRNAFPSIMTDDQDLVSIPGTPPPLLEPDEGCRFAPRCPFAEERCWSETPQSEPYGDGNTIECHRADEHERIRPEASKSETWREQEEVIEADD